MSTPTTETQSANEFESAGQSQRTGLVGEFIDFLMNNKKWWLLPIVVVMLMVGAVVILGGTAAPFIYTLF